MFWIFKNKFLLVFFLIVAVLFIRSSINIFYNLSNYNKIEKGIIININESSGEGTSRRMHFTVLSQDGLKLLEARDDDSEDCIMKLKDPVTYIDIGLGYCLLTTCKNYELKSTFQKIDVLSFFLFTIILLGFLFVPKFIKKLENDQNQKITKYLEEKYKKSNF